TVATDRPDAHPAASAATAATAAVNVLLSGRETTNGSDSRIRLGELLMRPRPGGRDRRGCRHQRPAAFLESSKYIRSNRRGAAINPDSDIAKQVISERLSGGVREPGTERRESTQQAHRVVVDSVRRA